MPAEIRTQTDEPFAWLDQLARQRGVEDGQVAEAPPPATCLALHALTVEKHDLPAVIDQDVLGAEIGMIEAGAVKAGDSTSQQLCKLPAGLPVGRELIAQEQAKVDRAGDFRQEKEASPRAVL